MDKDKEITLAKQKALEAQHLYNAGRINFGEAEEMMENYKVLFNEMAAERAKKYNVKPMKFSVKMFLRYGR